MSKKLYVGGLPYSITDDRLEEMFAPHGTVESARVVTDRATGQPRGFGFVEMLIFIFILVVGLVYAWRKRALEWK